MRSSSTMLRGSLASGLALWTSTTAAAQIRSRANPDVTVSFNETTICETTPGVKAYSGYVTLPASLDPRQPYESNIFFWFFESRSSPETAPLSIWLQGGPGSASIDQAVSGHNGPCVVTDDSAGTRLNPSSWTEVANMLYIDQPVQTGFSYDTVLDGVINFQDGSVDVSGTAPEPTDATTLRGKFASQDPSQTANSTLTSARAIYHFLQAWFDEFEGYRRDAVSIWSQSYGGHYGPAIASLIMQEKKDPGSALGVQGKRKRATCDGAGEPHSFGVDSVGIINGLVDILVQLPSFPDFAVNNTYGIESYPPEVLAQVQEALYGEGQCMDQARACRALQAARDADGLASDPEVLGLCAAAFELCWLQVASAFDLTSGRYWFDIAQTLPFGFPRAHALGWLNRPEVLAALGARVNYTETSNPVTNAFVYAGDFTRGFDDVLGELIDDGVKVALIYGDRDYRCNWFGGEAVSLDVKYSKNATFAAAGYADLTVGGSVVGNVRQEGLYSFSRIYNAGHEVPFWKPAESLEIFRRTLAGRDLATGLVDASSPAGYATTGPSSVLDVRLPAEPVPGPECYTRAAPLGYRCTEAQIAALVDGSAVVEDYVVVSPAADA